VQELQYPAISITLSSTDAPAARTHTHDSERNVASDCLSHPSATDTRSLTNSLACSASADVYTHALSRSEAQAKLDVSFYPFLDAGYITGILIEGYKRRDRQRQRYTVRQTDRQTDRQSERERERESSYVYELPQYSSTILTSLHTRCIQQTTPQRFAQRPPRKSRSSPWYC